MSNLDSRWENWQGAVAGQGRFSLTQHGPCRERERGQDGKQPTQNVKEIIIINSGALMLAIKNNALFTWSAAVLLMINRGVEGSGQRGLALWTGSHTPWPPLIAQLLLPPPLGSSVWKPHLPRSELLFSTRGCGTLCGMWDEDGSLTCILASGKSILFANLSLAKTSG